MLLFAEASVIDEAAFWLTIIRIVSGLGAITAFVAAFRYSWNCWRWFRFKRLVKKWFDLASGFHPREMQDPDWKTLVERLLTASWFSPFEVQTLLKLSITTSKGIVANRLV